MSDREMTALGTASSGNSNGGNTITIRPPASGGATNAYVTRLHVRYDAKSFPEDLTFIETADRENFQGRYIMQHPYAGKISCSVGESFRASLPARFEQEARTLADLTGWPLKEIETRMAANGQPMPDAK